MREQEINNTFEKIRHLPLEFDFVRIENLVLHQSSGQKSITKKWFLNKKYLSGFSIVVITLVIILLMLSKQKTDTSIAGDPIHSSGVISQEKKIPLTVGKPDAVPTRKNIPVNSHDKIHAVMPVIFGDVKKESSMLHQNKKEVIPQNINTSLPAITDSANNKLNDNSPKKVITLSSCFCDFGDDDVWRKAFVREMKKDKIISDTAGLQFTISGKYFRVNGKNLDDQVVLKYISLYHQSSNKYITDSSKISLSVGGSSCSLSKTADN